MTTLSRQLCLLTVAALLGAGQAARAQTPAADPAKPLPADPVPIALPTTPQDKPGDKSPAKPAAKPAPKKAEAKKPEGIAFTGKVTATDKVNFTLTLTKDRVLHVTSETRIFKGGKPQVFDDVAVGDELSGQHKKGGAGELEALVINVGAKPAAPAPGKKSDKKPADKSPGTPKP